MTKLIRRTNEPGAGFSDRRGSVCNVTCRSRAIRERPLERAIVQGVWFR